MAKIELDMLNLARRVWTFETEPITVDALPEEKQFGKMGSRYYRSDDKGRTYFMPIKLGGLDLPPSVVSISGGNIIEDTPLTERGGDAKEFISSTDIKLRVRGIIVSEGNSYPENVVSDIRALVSSGKALEMRSVITDLFLVTPERSGYNKVVVYDWNFPSAPGVKNVRPFEIFLKSDEPFDLYID